MLLLLLYCRVISSSRNTHVHLWYFSCLLDFTSWKSIQCANFRSVWVYYMRMCVHVCFCVWNNCIEFSPCIWHDICNVYCDFSTFKLNWKCNLFSLSMCLCVRFSFSRNCFVCLSASPCLWACFFPLTSSLFSIFIVFPFSTHTYNFSLSLFFPYTISPLSLFLYLFLTDFIPLFRLRNVSVFNISSMEKSCSKWNWFWCQMQRKQVLPIFYFFKMNIFIENFWNDFWNKKKTIPRKKKSIIRCHFALILLQWISRNSASV